MDYLKYFKQNNYIKGENDCWTFVRQIYKDETGKELPLVPIFENQSDEITFAKANIKHKELSMPKKGALIHVWTKDYEHIGYVIDDNKYIHKTFKGVTVSQIPKKNRCFYEVLG